MTEYVACSPSRLGAEFKDLSTDGVSLIRRSGEGDNLRYRVESSLWEIRLDDKVLIRDVRSTDLRGVLMTLKLFGARTLLEIRTKFVKEMLVKELAEI